VEIARVSSTAPWPKPYPAPDPYWNDNVFGVSAGRRGLAA
jgi:hypothetical protein